MNSEAIRLSALGKSVEEIRDALRPKGLSHTEAAEKGLKEELRASLYEQNSWFRETINDLHKQYDYLVTSILQAAANTTCTAEEFTVFARVKAVEANKVRELIAKLTE